QVASVNQCGVAVLAPNILVLHELLVRLGLGRIKQHFFKRLLVAIDSFVQKIGEGNCEEEAGSFQEDNHGCRQDSVVHHLGSLGPEEQDQCRHSQNDDWHTREERKSVTLPEITLVVHKDFTVLAHAHIQREQHVNHCVNVDRFFAFQQR